MAPRTLIVHTGDCHGSDALFAADETHKFICGGFYADLLNVQAEGFGDADFHLANVRINLWRLGDDRCIDVHDFAFFECDLAGGFLQKNFAGRSLPTWVGVREKMADVFFTERSEDGVANRMHERVRIRMAVEPFGVRNFHAAEDEFASGDQLMNVVTNANVNHGRRLTWQGNPTKQFMAGAFEIPC